MKLLDLTLATPPENLACDEVLLDIAEAGHGGEVLRFWEAVGHFVVVGYSNKVATEVNTAACEANGIPILRRCTGGGTVLQGPGCLNYSLVLMISDDRPLHSIASANKFIMEQNRAAIQSAVDDPRLPIRVEGHTDLTIGGRKFSGNSQRRQKQFLLYHGTFLLDFDLTLVSELLPLPSKQPEYRKNRSHSDFLVNLGIAADTVKTALVRTWNATGNADVIPMTQISKLAADKYGNRDWNFKF